MAETMIDEYNSEWLDDYEGEKAKIVLALQDILIAIEHIGSTSVPKLSAKPVIDMMVGVSHLNEITENHLDQLHQIDYAYVAHPGFPERRFFRRGQWRAGTHHLHIYKYDGEHWNHNLLFRNYLIHHPETRIEYAELKKDLANRYINDRAAYTKAKEPFITGVIQKAIAERQTQ